MTRRQSGTWVTKRKASEDRGFTSGQIRARIQRRIWREGVEWAWVDGVQLLNLDAIDARADVAAARARDRTRTRSRAVRALK